MEGKVNLALKDLRESLQVDGADMKVDKVEEGIVYISLVISNESCKGCILPKDVLENVTISSLQKQAPEIRSVVLDDPR